MSDILTELRAATQYIHQELESVPYHTALIAEKLPQLSAINYLRTLATVHATLENALKSIKNPELLNLFNSCAPKLPSLLADIKKLGERENVPAPSIVKAASAAYSFSNSIIGHTNDPYYLTGVLYVLEGSQNGGAFLKQLYAKILNILPDELTYFGFYGQQTGSKWRSFTQKLTELRLTQEHRESIIKGARQSFESIEKILQALHPFSDNDLSFHVSALNPEAGDHRIPQDPKELDFALRAGQRAWKKYDYLEKRFGDRGKRFTTSDSCWLVSLSKFPSETTTQSLKWLRSVLASRGIPTTILESHLYEIQNEMKSNGYNSTRITSYDRFLAELKSERLTAVEPEKMEAIIQEYNYFFKSASGEKVNHAADLILSAWLDQKAGISEALFNIEKWFCDEKHFSPEWRSVVKKLISKLNENVVQI